MMYVGTLLLPWRNRWGILKKLSPTADCVHLYLYKESELVSFEWKAPRVDRTPRTTKPLIISLVDVFGVDLQSDLLCEKHVLSIICPHQIVTLAFYSHGMLECWSTFVSRYAGQSFCYKVGAVKSTHSVQFHCGTGGEYRLYSRGSKLCLITHGSSKSAPKHIAWWSICNLWKFGVQNDCFCFVAAGCTDYPGVYALVTHSAHEIDTALKTAVRRKTELGEINGTMTAAVSVQSCSNTYSVASPDDVNCMPGLYHCCRTNCSNCSDSYLSLCPASSCIHSTFDRSCSDISEVQKFLLSSDCDGSAAGSPVAHSCDKQKIPFVSACMTTSQLHDNNTVSSRCIDDIDERLLTSCCDSDAVAMKPALSLSLHNGHGCSGELTDHSRCGSDNYLWRRHSFSDLSRKFCNIIGGLVKRSVSKFSIVNNENGFSAVDDTNSVVQQRCCDDRTKPSSHSCHRSTGQSKCVENSVDCRSVTETLSKFLSETTLDQQRLNEMQSHVVFADDCHSIRCQKMRKSFSIGSQLADIGVDRPTCGVDHSFSCNLQAGACVTPTLKLPITVSSKGARSVAQNVGLRDNLPRSHKEALSNGRFVETESASVLMPLDPSITIQSSSDNGYFIDNMQRSSSCNHRPVMSGVSHEDCLLLSQASISNSTCSPRTAERRERVASCSSSSPPSLPPPTPVRRQLTDTRQISERGSSTNSTNHIFQPKQLATEAFDVTSRLAEKHGATGSPVRPAGITTQSAVSANAENCLQSTAGDKRSSRKPNLTINTQLSSPVNSSLAGSSLGSAVPRRFLSDLRPPRYSQSQSQPVTPVCMNHHNSTLTAAASHRTSQAMTSLRPRTGKEYLRINRRRLASTSAVDCSSSSRASTPRSPGSRSLATFCVFDFDSLKIAQGQACGSWIPSDSSNSIDLESVLMAGKPPAVASAVVNYADIDHSSDRTSRRSEMQQHSDVLKHDVTEYAQIDYEATEAVYRAGRQHARHRLDKHVTSLSPQFTD